ncbi:MAG: lipoyl synthase [Candidatus Aminicenantales bacterium]
MNATGRNLEIPNGNNRPEGSSKPSWLKVKLPSGSEYFRVAEILKSHRLHTICQSALCPNIGECWSKKTATFLILGNQCTRACGFCAVAKGNPSPPDEAEPEHVAGVIRALGLEYAVITSVTRDDLADGGSSFFARTIRAVRAGNPRTRIEVLVPDFNGSAEALDTVLAAGPDILNHNLETAEPIYPLIRRPRANYRRSLALIAAAKKRKAVTKSGLMIGLGEKHEDILQTMSDLRRAGCDLLTIGQYLRPAPENAPVAKYYSPREFEQLRDIAIDFGFMDVAAGPLVRSSFHADELFRSVKGKD